MYLLGTCQTHYLLFIKCLAYSFINIDTLKENVYINLSLTSHL